MTVSGRGCEVAVLSVGDELLSGEVADTNFAHIAGELSALGLVVREHETVADEEGEIADAVERLSAKCGALIVTGGLGPTSDDLTREGIARAAGVPLVPLEHVVKRLRSFFASLDRDMPDENLKQALMPEGAEEIPITRGTAPGFMLDINDCLVAAMPGVPTEMAVMLSSHVIPALHSRFKGAGVTVTRKLMTFGKGESDVAQMIGELLAEGRAHYGFLALGGPIAVKMTVGADSFEEASRLLDEEEGRVRERLGRLVYAVGDVPIEEVVGRMLREDCHTLSVAESCTGGMVAARMTNMPGSSHCFLGGVVTYSPRSKASILGVPEEVLSKGVVSMEVAEEMAKGVKRVFSSDIGASVTGLAGPDNAGEDKPVGTVCFAVADSANVRSYEVMLPGDRSMVRSIATYGLINAVRLHLEGEKDLLPH